MRMRALVPLSILLLFGPLFIFGLGKVPVADAAASRRSSLMLAYDFISEGFLDLASIILNRTITGESDDIPLDEERIETHFILGLTHQSLDNPEAAKGHFKEIIASPDISADVRSLALALLGDLELAEGNLNKAKQLLEQSHEGLPDHARIVFLLGEIAELTGDLDEAIQKYIEASEISGDWLLPIVRSAAIYNTRGEYDEAAMVLFGAEFLGTRDVAFHLELARSLQGIYALIIADPNLALEESLKSRLGLEEQEPKTALLSQIHHALDRVLQLAPDHPEALTLLQATPPIS